MKLSDLPVRTVSIEEEKQVDLKRNGQPYKTKACTRKAVKKWRDEHPEKVKEYNEKKTTRRIQNKVHKELQSIYEDLNSD